jgi:amino acid transporter
VPALVPARLALDLGAIGLIVLINLRGLRSAGTIFAVPTYLFLVSFGLMLVVGIGRAVTRGGLTAAIPPTAPFLAVPATVPLTPLLLLTAFASGCSAMTGVEAISNGVPAFIGQTRQAQAQRAAQTLVVMMALLVTFFLGTTYLAWRIGAVPSPTGEPTITAQIARFASSGAAGWLFYIVQAATLLILVFAANTSFADFPRLASILARDSFLPAFFAYRGERTAFSVGILLLGCPVRSCSGSSRAT